MMQNYEMYGIIVTSNLTNYLRRNYLWDFLTI